MSWLSDEQYEKTATYAEVDCESSPPQQGLDQQHWWVLSQSRFFLLHNHHFQVHDGTFELNDPALGMNQVLDPRNQYLDRNFRFSKLRRSKSTYVLQYEIDKFQEVQEKIVRQDRRGRRSYLLIERHQWAEANEEGPLTSGPPQGDGDGDLGDANDSNTQVCVLAIAPWRLDAS